MAYFHCLIGGGSSGGGYELTVTCDADFAGTTITCTDGVTTLTKTCPSASPYEVVFAIPNGGEWTVSGVIGSASYSASIDIPDSLELHSVPEGSTVLPTDDIQIWLKCAGITDKSYTTLNEVLADSTTLLALMSDNNAVDYLVRSTTWASGITADSTAMTDIGANNYCADTLLSDSTWAEAICNSTYFESVLNVKVPTMTSDTTPSGTGTVIYSTQYSDQQGYKAFDKNSSTTWSPNAVNLGWIGFHFDNPIKVMKASVFQRLNATYNGVTETATIQGSNTGNSDDWHDVSDVKTFVIMVASNQKWIDFDINNSDSYTYYRMNVTAVSNNNVWATCAELQFYGRASS